MFETIIAPIISTVVVLALIGIIYRKNEKDIKELKETKQNKEIADEQNKVIHECFENINTQLKEGTQIMTNLDKSVALLTQKLQFIEGEKGGKENV